VFFVRQVRDEQLLATEEFPWHQGSWNTGLVIAFPNLSFAEWKNKK
jgi:hypothetical protein